MPDFMKAYPRTTAGANGSLARPDDPRNPIDIGHCNSAVAMLGIERFELDRLCGLALELFHHDFAVLGLDHDPIALSHRRAWRNNDDIAIAISRLHRVAGDFQRVGVFVAHRREGDFLPAFADRET